MATSPYGGRVRVPSARYDAEYTRAHNLVVHDVFLNNLCHAADEGVAQVRVAAVTPGIAVTGTKDYLETGTITTIDRWYPIVSHGPWPMPLRQSRRSYKLRVRVGGASGSGGTEVSFALVLGPADVSIARTLLEDTEDYVYVSDPTSSTTEAWLTGQSQGSLDPTCMVIGAAQAERWRRRTRTLTGIGGDEAVVDQCLVALHVFGRSKSTSVQPRLYGTYAAEFVGKT